MFYVAKELERLGGGVCFCPLPTQCVTRKQPRGTQEEEDQGLRSYNVTTTLCVTVEKSEEKDTKTEGKKGQDRGRRQPATSSETDSSTGWIACVYRLSRVLCREGSPTSEKLLTPCHQITTAPYTVCMHIFK